MSRSEYAWVQEKCKEVDDIQELYELYETFKKETGYNPIESTYRRKCRRSFYHGSQRSTGNVKVMRDAEGPNLNIVTESCELRTLEQLLAYCNVDLDQWEVQRHVVNSWGSEANENFQVKAWLRLRDYPILEEVASMLLEDMKDYAPTYSPVKRVKREPGGNLFELSLFDHHYGQLSWGKETRAGNYDVKIAGRLAHSAVDYLLNRARDVSIDKVLIPIGNDFFNVNSMENITVHGTPQTEDERWKKTFVSGRKLWVAIIEKCLTIAPVEVLIIPGNHDAERSFYLGDALSCWFNKAEDVIVDNGPAFRKYFEWGKCLLGFTHGDNEVKGVLVNLMATEMPLLWARTKYREWHKGHEHHAKAHAFQVLNEEQGARERILPSLVALDDYHASKGYSALRESTGMIWNKDKGNTDIFMFHPGGKEYEN